MCWDAGIPAVRARPLPAVALSPLGFRCTGSGPSRRCVDRTRYAPPFACRGAVCEQPHPRMPDDGEWECADFAGIVVCRGSTHAAGVPPGAADTGFECGQRRGTKAVPGERICVDLSPDFPDGEPRGWRCRYEPKDGLVRTCMRDSTAHAVTDACDRMHPCVSGLSCVDAICVPVDPLPACWLDEDCGQCRLGTCMQGVP